MPSVLITGANRGIGLEFAKQYSAEGWQVIAACRTPLSARDFAALGMDITELRYDAMDDASAVALANRLKGRPIDVVIINAGLGSGPDLGPEEVTPEHWEPIMLTNTFAPLHLAALLEPNIRLGEKKVLATVSGLAASMSLYEVPRQFAYRASKAALNQMWRNLSVEWRGWGCICLPMHPGRVKTRMTDFAGDLTPEETVRGMRNTIANAAPQMSGMHYSYDGKPVAW
jgi:NAD(P)-dependent dehydrogenase (short-subunit alcohol dehydrogenase family)